MKESQKEKEIISSKVVGHLKSIRISNLLLELTTDYKKSLDMTLTSMDQKLFNTWDKTLRIKLWQFWGKNSGQKS